MSNQHYLLRSLPAQYLLCLYDNGTLYGAELQKLLNTDANRIYIIRNKLSQAGLLEYYKESRVVNNKLTSKGKEVALWLYQIRRSLRLMEEQI